MGILHTTWKGSNFNMFEHHDFTCMRLTNKHYGSQGDGPYAGYSKCEGK